jgi:UDPglucose 6-dehydrogenase
MKTKIGIIGQGFVGSAVKEGMKNHFNILAYDKDPSKYSNSQGVENIVKQCEILFVCVPTPMRKSGECDLSILNLALQEINDYCISNIKDIIVIIKSTIPPGTTDKLNNTYSNCNIVFNPEFLTEANAIEDYKNQNRIIVGGDRPYTSIVKRIFEKVFPSTPIIKTSATIAEMIKYVTNSFLATKVSFANEMYQICQGLDIDYDKVIEYAKYDNRLGYSHWSVPGPDGDFGFGGHCFPKDVSALIYLADSLGVNPTMLNGTVIKNNEVRTDKDWEKQIGRAVSED